MVLERPRLSSTGFFDLADSPEQDEVLHVAGADLEHVHVLVEDLDVSRVGDLADDGQTGLRAAPRPAA